MSVEDKPLPSTNPYRSTASIEPVQPESQVRLHEWLTYDEIEELRLIFKAAHNQNFEYNEFRQILLKFNIYLSNDDYMTLFAKMNTNRDSRINWDEFISHLILGFQEDDPYNQKETLTNPISGSPEVKKSGHRHPIVNIKNISTVMPDRSIKPNTGGYVTVSKEGMVNFWSQDLEIQRSGVSKNPYFKVAQTWVLAVSTMSDVRIVCTSSSERDLRFYDITATNFHLRIIINSLPWCVCCMYYDFPPSVQQTCKLAMGDAGGNIRLIEFYPELRGPFQNKPGTALIEMTWTDLTKGRLPQMKVREFLNIHIDIVRQVIYSSYLNSVFSVAECHTNSMSACPAMAAIDLGVKKSISKFHTPKGITTFSLDDDNLVIATGGPDCLVRLWNPLVPQKPVGILTGHHAGIVFVFLQSDERKVYSIDHHKIIKVWDLNEQALLQTYIGLQQLIPRRSPFVCYYNKKNHELLVGTRRLISIKCCPLLRMDLTDGETHSGPVSAVLYNTLFKSIVTCGLDSFIIVWDPWTGKRLTLIKNAHVRISHGKSLRVEITAACFDPMQQLLLTGARNGTLKVWNFNSGICMRNLCIEAMCEVTTVFWIKSRILAIGWNRHVTEFADVEGQEYSDGKNWETLHDEDVLCAAIKQPEVLATGSYSGIVILWKLETGQPYRQYSVAHPTQFLKIVYGKRGKAVPPGAAKKEAEKTRFPTFERRRESMDDSEINMRTHGGSNAAAPNAANRASIAGAVPPIGVTTRYRRLSVIQMPTRSAIMRPLSIQSMIFLKSRPASKEHGTLFVALENGLIQIFSHHNLGGFIEQFSAIHMPGDCVVAMVTDEQDRYLFTATAFGYIKTWLMTNYCVPESEYVPISMPKLRLRFPFLIADRFDGRAKRSARGQIVPMLLNSYKAHLRPISALQYIDRAHILVSGSTDDTTRLWSLGGRYLGTLGTPLAWLKLNPNEPVSETDNYRIPPDIAKVQSSTTLKVLTGGRIEKYTLLKTMPQKEAEDAPKMAAEADVKSIYGKPLTEPILGKHFQLPLRGRPHLKPTLDKSLPYIPVYAHLEIHKAKPIERPPTPEALKRARELDFLSN